MMVQRLKWCKSHIGMIHYSDYWGTYSLVLDVDLDTMNITELDNFGDTNHLAALVRIHCTPLDENDNFFSIPEFMNLLPDWGDSIC